MFRFLVSNARVGHAIEQTSAVVMQRQRVTERLEALLSNLEQAEEGEASFYTAALSKERCPSLILHFNAGIDPDPEYSHAVTGRLYLSEKKEFCFSYWPRVSEGFRTEVLLGDVRHLEWQFFNEEWRNEWPKSQGIAPQMVRLALWCGIEKRGQKEPNLRFAFVLSGLAPIEVAQ